MTRRAALPLAVALAAGAAGCAANARSSTPTRKQVVVLGIDGMDPNFLERHWPALPNLARLRDDGGFVPLATTGPPQSPVAWSTFITGMDPAGHGIYDFIHRDPKTLMPFSSMSQTAEGGFSIPLGPYVLPIASGRVVSLRQGKPFWQTLSEHRVPVAIIRMPTDFPPVHCDDGVALAGMGAPDLRGGFGTFTFFTTDPAREPGNVPGGRIVRIEAAGGVARLEIQGPDNVLRKDKAPTVAWLTAYLDPAQRAARFDTDGRRFVLRQGEWSNWIPARFPLLGGFKTVGGMFRVYAKQLAPTVEIYVSPVNIDPADPALPIASPESYSRELARAVGPFYTQGMAQDTAALRRHVLDRAEYRAQSRIVSLEHLRLLHHALRSFREGFLFFHFFGVDQDSHMLWGKYEDELLETYRMVDDAVGEVRAAVPHATLMVMSDHGFGAFDRTVHLNAWLAKEGFLTLDDPKNAGDDELFQHVDWTRTQAYSVGLNGLYLNIRGREREGSLEPGEEAEALLRKLERRLLEWRDPATGKPVVAEALRPPAGARGAVPDLIVGYQPGFRSSWQTALGAVPAKEIENNNDEWRGDHCIAPRFVPGVLLSNRRIAAREPRLLDLPVAVLAEFGVAAPPVMPGKSVY